jgi:hypothetical protein
LFAPQLFAEVFTNERMRIEIQLHTIFHLVTAFACRDDPEGECNSGTWNSCLYAKAFFASR